MKFTLLSFSFILSMLSACDSCSTTGSGATSSNQNSDSSGGGSKNENLDKLKKANIEKKIQKIQANLSSKNVYDIATKSDLEKEINDLKQEINNISNLDVLDTSIQDKLTSIEKKNEVFNTAYDEAKKNVQSTLDESTKQAIKNAEKTILNSTNLLTDTEKHNQMHAFLKIDGSTFNKLVNDANNKKITLENAIKTNPNEVDIKKANDELNQVNTSLLNELERLKPLIENALAQAEQERLGKEKAEAVGQNKNKNKDKDKDKVITEWTDKLELNKDKKDAIANLNLTSKQSFIDGFTNDFDNFSNTLFANLEGTSLEQREWLKEAVKEIKNPDLFKYASSYFTTNFNTYSSPVAEYNIFLEMQKIDKNFSDRNISQGITDNINNNYKNCQETFKEILNTMIEEKIPGLFSSITENKEDIIEKALYSIDNNALNEYLKNTATDNEMISIISNKSIKSIYYKNAIDIVKIYNDKNIKDKNDKLNDIFNSYISQDFKINDRDLNHDKENKQRIKDMLEYLLTTNNTKITLDKKKFSDLFYNINNEILLNYINNINTQDTNKLTYLSEFQKELFGYNQPIEKITKLFETMKNKNLELSANAITDDFIIKSYINAKDSQQQKNIKKYIRTTLGYMTSLKDLKIDNDFSLLSKVLITKEDRKEFYELLSKNSNNLPQDLVKKTIGMIVSSNNDDNLISYMKNYKKMMLDEAKRILGIYQSLNQNTYKKQIDNINKLTESIENL